jgi:hypothetical protein
MAVLLVGASFAAGAAVNGLGHGWIRSLIRGNPSREAVAVSVAGDEDPRRRDDPPAKGVDPEAETVPAAAPPALVPDPLPPRAPPRRADPPPPASVPLEVPIAGPISGAEAKSEPEPEPESEPGPGAPGILEPKALGVEAPRDEGTPSLAEPRDVPAPPPPSEPRAEAPAKDRAWADAPGSAPAAAALPRPAGGGGPPRLDPILAPAAAAPSPPEPEARPAGDWAALRRRMHELGVGRYWIEGEPAGVVRFRCVVPLAGARAVGQLFEAEGEDDLQAAEAALRRVALWRATETP